jgi:hypothetical protein
MREDWPTLLHNAIQLIQEEAGFGTSSVNTHCGNDSEDEYTYDYEYDEGEVLEEEGDEARENELARNQTGVSDVEKEKEKEKDEMREWNASSFWRIPLPDLDELEPPPNDYTLEETDPRPLIKRKLIVLGAEEEHAASEEPEAQMKRRGITREGKQEEEEEEEEEDEAIEVEVATEVRHWDFLRRGMARDNQKWRWSKW